MTGIGFDTLALSGLGFMACRYVLNAIRHDVGRSERMRIARDSRLSF